MSRQHLCGDSETCGKWNKGIEQWLVKRQLINLGFGLGWIQYKWYFSMFYI